MNKQQSHLRETCDKAKEILLNFNDWQHNLKSQRNKSFCLLIWFLLKIFHITNPLYKKMYTKPESSNKGIETKLSCSTFLSHVVVLLPWLAPTWSNVVLSYKVIVVRWLVQLHPNVEWPSCCSYCDWNFKPKKRLWWRERGEIAECYECKVFWFRNTTLHVSFI